MSLMLLATAGTLAANIINNEIAANTIMVTKTAHNPITGRRDAFGANGVCSWKVFDERFTAFRLKQRFFRVFANSIPANENSTTKQHSAQSLGICRVTEAKQHKANRISSNITTKAVDSGICGTDNQFSYERFNAPEP